MSPASRQPLIMTPALVALLAGCGTGQGVDMRPPAKPEEVSVTLARPDRKTGEAPLAQARVSTRSGQVLMTEPDGSVRRLQLDSREGREVLRKTDAQIKAVRDGRNPVWAGMVAENVLKAEGPTAREKAVQEFAALGGSALPDRKEGIAIVPQDFLGTRVSRLGAEGTGNLAEVHAAVREGVDADIAFSYATCALARWAEGEGVDYARHIRTVQSVSGGQKRIGAIYLLSSQKPVGLRVMETNETLRECKNRGIPAA